MPNYNLLNVRPVFTGGLGNWLLGGFDLLYVFSPIYIVFFYLPFIRNGRSAKRIALASLGLSFPLLFLTGFGSVATFGRSIIPMISWPGVELFHIINLPIVLMEQGGFLFIIAWYGFLLIAIGQGLFFIGHELNAAFPAIKRNWATPAFCAAVFLFSLLPMNAITINALLHRWRYPLNLSVFVPFFLTWLMARIRCKKHLSKGE